MLANLVCAQSSGSTALARILDRHPDIASGSEMFLFCHPFLYTDYPRFRRHAWLIRMIGLSSNPFASNRALFRNLADFQLSKGRFWKWARESRTLQELAGRAADHVRQLTGKPVWLEKTPWNIYAIGRFIESFPDARVIHLVRDPRDVIASLCKRGPRHFPLRAAQHWMTSVAAIQPHRLRANVIEVRYEDLCRNSEPELERICRFLGRTFKPGLFATDDHSSRGLNRWTGHRSWSARPDSGFSAAAVGRHRESKIDWSFLPRLRLTAPFAALIGTEQWTMTALAKSYGYDVPLVPPDGRFESIPIPRPLDPARKLLDRWMGMPGYIPQIERRV
jgi:hypothetical protein